MTKFKLPGMAEIETGYGFDEQDSIDFGIKYAEKEGLI